MRCFSSLSCLLFTLLVCVGCGSPGVWKARTTPACLASTGDAALDRERTYLAALLALNERKYVTVHTEAPVEIEADFQSSHKPDVAHTTWVLRVQGDASLEVDTPPNKATMHGKTERWYSGLVSTHRRLHCRDVNWLRWEAQNKGLLPIGAAGLVQPSPATSGAEQLPRSGSANPHAARLAALENERASLHLSRVMIIGGVGAGLGAFGLGLIAQGGPMMLEDCREPEHTYDQPDCSSRDAGRILLWTGVASGAAALTLLSVALPLGIKKLRKSKALSKEIDDIRNAQVSFGGGHGAFGVTLRGSF